MTVEMSEKGAVISAQRIGILLDNCAINLKRNSKKWKSNNQYILKKDSYEDDDGNADMNLLHQTMMIAKDSVIGRLGLLDLFIRTTDGRFIECHPAFRIPRTFKVFSKVMRLLYNERSGRLIANNDPNETVLMRILGADRIKQTFSEFNTVIHIGNDSSLRARPLQQLLTVFENSNCTSSSGEDQAKNINQVLFTVKLNDDLIPGTATFPDIHLTMKRLRLSEFEIDPVTLVNRICNQCERELEVERLDSEAVTTINQLEAVF